MITIKRLSSCTFEQALQIWNEGFKGYFINATLNMNNFLTRFGNEGLAPELSVAAFSDEKPVGFVLNGIRTVEGLKVAWNGGMAVLPEFRRQGIGRTLMEATLGICQEEGVSVATLEAISQNKPAILLYQSLGYQIVDRLLYMQQQGSFQRAPFPVDPDRGYQSKTGMAQDVRTLSFYRRMGPWQTHWASIRDGQSTLVLDGGQIVGYTLYKRIYNPEGELSTIALYQCRANPSHAKANEIIRFALAETFAPERACNRIVINLPATNHNTWEALRDAGFEVATEQVFMMKQMKKTV